MNLKATVGQEAPGELAQGEMSLLEHLEELRRRLVRAALAIAVFFVLSWGFANQLFGFIQKPIVEALARAE
ncbi:MAG: twin-arginine translocase subunit TatC, partial [Acidobacteria bacterium]|nr:twin-arginine translocase subunit TatC [Acidobacteriota bacterium]